MLIQFSSWYKYDFDKKKKKQSAKEQHLTVSACCVDMT